MHRRDFLRGTAAVFGTALGARLGGPLVGTARAATETSHLLFVYYHGGFNAVLGGAGSMFNNVAFGTTSSNLKAVGNGVFTDLATFGTLPQVALDHWAAVGFRHGAPLHTQPDNPNNGSEKAITRKGQTGASYLTTLAAAMGGTSPLKAAHTGPYPYWRVQPAAGGVSMQNILDWGDVLKAVGADAAAVTGPTRDGAAASLEAAAAMSHGKLTANADSLGSLDDAYQASVASLRQPAPPPITKDEILTAYGLSSTNVSGFAAQMAAAEVMIRAAGSNVVTAWDGSYGEWDFNSGPSMTSSRAKLLGQGGYGVNKMAPLKTFCQRMLSLPDKNVVVVCLGDFVRLTVGHGHGDGCVAAVFGKYLKQGLNFPCDGAAKFGPSTPGVDAFWASIAKALKVTGAPFGSSPYTYV